MASNQNRYRLDKYSGRKYQPPLLEFLQIQNYVFALVNNAKKILIEEEMNKNKLQESAKRDQGEGSEEPRENDKGENETKSLDEESVDKSLHDEPLPGFRNESCDDQFIKAESECPDAGELDNETDHQLSLLTTPELIVALCREGGQTELPTVESETKITGEKESVDDLSGNDCVQSCSQTWLSVEEINVCDVPAAEADTTQVLSAAAPSYLEKPQSDFESALPLKQEFTTDPVVSEKTISRNSDVIIPEMNSIQDTGNTGDESELTDGERSPVVPHVYAKVFISNQNDDDDDYYKDRHNVVVSGNVMKSPTPGRSEKCQIEDHEDHFEELVVTSSSGFMTKKNRKYVTCKKEKENASTSEVADKKTKTKNKSVKADKKGKRKFRQRLRDLFCCCLGHSERGHD
ncbi:uncharacterized protein LOC114526492 [Dendronephthya gigantea]|uniref:uncharacterized protein LOC114526492 n=1 Tax=Dendronephthya gigantea TaxID=151771 RepID=UPI00106C2DB6|nr:uncharacterized protein LOC114526492 [Dendronephthya gigantea]